MFNKCPHCQARVAIKTGCCPSCLRSWAGVTCDPVTLDIRGRLITKTEIRLRVGAAVTLLALGVFSLYLLKTGSSLGVPSDFSREAWYLTIAFFSLLLAPFLPDCSEHTYLDFAERRVLTVKNYAWHETIRTCRPLSDFSHIVVRHLCHPDGEGGETFTGSIGLKPLDRGPILWVKDFDTTQDEVPPAAEEFARKLQKLTGLPLSVLWIGDTGFADRLHQEGHSRSQDRSINGLQSTPSGMNQASSVSRVHS